jgi:hypothetical protein
LPVKAFGGRPGYAVARRSALPRRVGRAALTPRNGDRMAGAQIRAADLGRPLVAGCRRLPISR